MLSGDFNSVMTVGTTGTPPLAAPPDRTCLLIPSSPLWDLGGHRLSSALASDNCEKGRDSRPPMAVPRLLALTLLDKA